MNNYQYIIASLPELAMDRMKGEKDADALIGEIKGLCSSRDVSVIEFLESGYSAGNLTADFYARARSSRCPFIREWFGFDLNVRNAKVRYLNSALGREKDKDVIAAGDPDKDAETEFAEAQELGTVLAGNNILDRERGIDSLYWKKADELSLFHYFDLTAILGFIVKLKIIDRWMKLDDARGREMFRELVDEVRGTFKGVEFSGSPRTGSGRERPGY